MQEIEPRLLADLRPSSYKSEDDAIEFRGVTTLFPRVIAASVAVLGLLYFIRGNTGVDNLAVTSLPRLLTAKRWDHVAYVTAVIAAAAITLRLLLARKQRTTAAVAAALAASIGLAVGIASIEEPALVLTFHYWSGFGISELLFVIVLAPLFWRLIEWNSLHQWLRSAISILIAGICASDLIGMYRPIYQVANPANDIYQLNEMLAPAAGKVPDANFIAQWEILYGWLLKPFVHHVSVTTLTAMACLIFTACSISAVGLGVLIAYRCLGRRSWAIAAAFVVPITCVTTFHSPLENLAGAFQDIPIRLFPVMLVYAFAIEELVHIQSKEVRRIRLVVLGILSAAAAWSNHDFALESVVVLALLLPLAATRWREGLRALAYWLSGLVPALLVYPVWAAINGTPISLREVFYFQLLFGNGYMEYPIQLPGPVMVIMPLVLGTAATGWFSLLKQRRAHNAEETNHNADRAALTAALFGTWSILAFSYYLDRSVAAGQLEIFLLPAGVSIAALVAMALPGAEKLRQRIRLRELVCGRANKAISSAVVGLLPVTLFGALPLATVLASANPVTAVQILTNPPPGTSFTWQSVVVNRLKYVRAYASAHGGSIAYFGDYGNYVSLATGVASVSITNAPPADGTKPSGFDCLYLASHMSTYLAVDPTMYPIFGSNICGLYRLVVVKKLDPWLVYHRVGRPPNDKQR
jgi:hydrogenase/urease accessory protein HupE